MPTIDVAIPADTNTIELENVTIQLTKKTAHLGFNGQDGGNPTVDFSTYYDGLSGADQTVITDFLKDIIGDSIPGTIVGNLFEPHP